MSAETTPKLETFLIVAYKRIRKPAGKVFRSIKRKHLTGIGDGRLKAHMPNFYYRPRLSRSGDFLLKLKSTDSYISYFSPLEQSISSVYEAQSQEYVHVFTMSKYGKVLNRETFRCKRIFECFLITSRSKDDSGLLLSSSYSCQKLLSQPTHRIHNKDSTAPFLSAPFIITFKNGVLHFRDELTSGVAMRNALENFQIVLGSTDISDCIVDSYVSSSESDPELVHPEALPGSIAAKAIKLRKSLLNKAEILRQVCCSFDKYKPGKSEKFKNPPMNEEWLDYTY